MVGVVGTQRLMPNDQWQFFRSSLPEGKIVEADAFLQELRARKSPREILQIRRAARIVKHTFEFLCRTSFSEPDDKLLEAALRREARLEGVEDFRMMIAHPSTKSWSFRPAEARPIRTDETIMINLAVEFERYWAEAVRTVSFRGSYFSEIRPEALQKLSAQIGAGLHAGKSAAQCYREAMAKIACSKQEYISDYGLGGGIGLSPQEHPLLAQADNTTLCPGMTFSFRLGFSDKERGAIMAGDTICLTKKGYEILTR